MIEKAKNKIIKRRFKYINNNRDYDDPKYKKLRSTVKKRDSYRCQFPHCRFKNRRKLQVHHILRWSDFPSLRYEISNCVTLCPRHHKFIRGKEEFYIKMFLQIVQQKRR